MVKGKHTELGMTTDEQTRPFLWLLDPFPERNTLTVVWTDLWRTDLLGDDTGTISCSLTEEQVASPDPVCSLIDSPLLHCSLLVCTMVPI